MSKKITQEELESYLWDSAVLLRNHIDAGAYKQYIFPLLFFKRRTMFMKRRQGMRLRITDRKQLIGRKHIIM